MTEAALGSEAHELVIGFGRPVPGFGGGAGSRGSGPRALPEMDASRPVPSSDEDDGA